MSIFGRKSDPPPGETPVEEPKDPQFVSVNDFQNFMSGFNEFKDNVTNFFMTQNKPAQAIQPVQAPVIEDVSDDEYTKAVRDGGEGAEKIIAKRHKADIQRAQLPLMQEINTLKTQGLGAIGNLTRAQLSSKPYYMRFKKEIDSALDHLAPEMQMNPQVLDSVYSMVIGQHTDTIADEKVQEAIRKASAPPTEEPASKARMKSSTGEELPTPEDVWGTDYQHALKDRFGFSGESAVQRFIETQGCKTWEQYVKEYIEPFEGAV